MIRVITGHICSGKSTWVRDHAAPVDVVVDLDRIALSISAETVELYEYPDHVRTIARAARWAAIDKAVLLHGRGGFDLWIVHAYPSEDDIGLYRRLGAGFKSMACDDDTLRARARAERPARVAAELERRLAENRVYHGKNA